MKDRKASESGEHVYPPMPVPRGRESEARLPRRKSSLDKTLVALVGGAAIGGIIVGFLLRPVISKDKRIGVLEGKVAEVEQVATTEKGRADELQKKVDTLSQERAAADSKLVEAQKAQTELAGKAAEAEGKAKEAAADQAKLKAVVDKSVGTISVDGFEIKLQLVDRALFKTGDDQLTDQGKKVLDRVASALKQIPEKQIWVHGHTDDQPIAVAKAPKPPPPPPAPKLKKGQKAPPAPKPPPAPEPAFATNWELSGARALSVVHYLQDVHKIEGARLAALAFGQYRPISKSTKALNRRIEIVLYPKPSPRK